MRAFKYLPLLGSLLFAAVSSQETSDLSPRDDTTTLEQFYSAMAKNGVCVIYIDDTVKNDGLTPCRKFCKAKGQRDDSAGCHSDHIPDGQGPYPTDTDGYEWYPGDCFCADKIDPVAEAFITPVIEGLAKLDEVICGVFVQAVVESINIGFAAVPGGQAAATARTATKAAVEGAKSFAENSLNPSDFFDGWVKKSCGIDKIELDYDSTFDSLVNAPDSVGTSTGCKRKRRGDCKKLDPKPDPKTTKKEDPPKTTKKGDSPTTTTKKDAGPTTTTTTTTATRSSTSSVNPTETAVTCQSCRSSKAKKAARDARWGSMFVPRAPGDSCLLDNSRRGESCAASGLQVRDGFLGERALTKADPKVTIAKKTFWIDTGKHKPCADAMGDSNIDKYYYLDGDAKCGGDLKFGTKGDVGDKEFQNDHVYEKQTLARFLEWLGDGTTTPIGGSTKPQASWVADVLLDEDSPRISKLQPSTATPLGIPAGGAPLDEVLAYGIARSDPLFERKGGMSIERTTKNFALVEAEVNENKGTFFKEGRPTGLSTQPNAVNLNRNWIRNHAGVFHYLRYTHAPPSTKENVWNKWMRVSNWVDLVLHEFDQSYPWGTHADEPTRTAGGNPSLRSFYAYWIDTYLGGIEAKAQSWADDAQKEFRRLHGSDKAAAATQWMNKAFGANGFAVRAQMSFPRPAGAASVYGAYGNPAMTFDRDGTAVNIGAPAPL